MSTIMAPQNFQVLQANRVVNVTFNPVITATSYIIQRSTDQINYTTVATISGTSYIDNTVLVGVQYWYQVAAQVSAVTGLFTIPQSVIPTVQGEMSLAELRDNCRLRADLKNSNFITTQEINSYINQSMLELYNLLVTEYEDYFVAQPAAFLSDGTTYIYPLPDGALTFKDGLNVNNTIVAQPFDKLKGVDIGINLNTGAWVTINKFNFSDRNRYVYPNSQSTIYGVFNLSYRLLGSNIMFIPTPTSGQLIRLWYIPKLPLLLQDTDMTLVSISGWIEYVIVDVAIKMMQKEESDVSVLMAQKQQLIKTIEDSARYRDEGRPNTISDTRGLFGYGDQSGPTGNFAGY